MESKLHLSILVLAPGSIRPLRAVGDSMYSRERALGPNIDVIPVSFLGEIFKGSSPHRRSGKWSLSLLLLDLVVPF